MKPFKKLRQFFQVKEELTMPKGNKVKPTTAVYYLNKADRIRLTRNTTCSIDHLGTDTVAETLKVSKDCVLVFLEEEKDMVIFLVTKSMYERKDKWAFEGDIIYFSKHKFVVSRVIKYEIL